MENAKENLFLGAPQKHFGYSRNLRRRQTEAERTIWECLRNRKLNGYKFRRQHPISWYILDFYCHETKLAVELDGEIHNTETAKIYDKKRDYYLKAQGITTLRFTNNEVHTDLTEVLNHIRDFLNLSPHPSPTGRAGVR